MRSRLVFLIIVFSTFLIGQDIQTFYLKNGEKIKGTVTNKNEITGEVTVQTKYGIISFHKDDIVHLLVQVELKSGEVIKGSLIEEIDSGIKVRSSLGEMSFSMNEIANYDFIESNPRGGKYSEVGERYNYADEMLIDIFFDPTGYNLNDNVFYLSGFSWGYGITDRLQITSNWVRYFDSGDINLRPKFQIFRKGNVKSEMVAAVGGHIHYSGFPDKYIFDESKNDGEWINIGDSDDKYTGDDMWGEVFASFTQSMVRSSGKGRMSFTAGGSLVLYPNHDVMPRVYGAFTSDVRRNMQLIMEIFYDPYYPTTYDFVKNKKTSVPVSLDFGYIWAYNDQFRIGLHLQRPFIAFYYEF